MDNQIGDNIELMQGLSITSSNVNNGLDVPNRNTGFNVLGMEKLIGSQNYQTWSFAMQTSLEYDGLWDQIVLGEGSVIIPEKNTRARCRIVLCIEKHLFAYIKKETTAKGTWLKLKSLFQDTGLDCRIGLLQKLCSIQLEEFNSVESYVNEITSLALQLGEIGFEVTDEWLGSLLLKGLPHSYKPMIMSLGVTFPTLSSDKIKVKILQDVTMPNHNGDGAT